MDQGAENELLSALTAERARSWVDVAETLTQLEALSRVSPTGRTWQDVLQDHMSKLGVPISAGHIYKIRRAYAFLKKNVPLGTSIEELRGAKVSAIEVAERLHRLDPPAGIAALHDAIGDDPISYVDLQARYEKALSNRPEMKSPRQLAWDTRRNGRAEKTTEADAAAEATPNKPSAVKNTPVEGPSDQLVQTLNDLLRQAWLEGRAAGRAESERLLQEKDDAIQELEDTVQDFEKDFKVLYPAYLNWRGDDVSVEWKGYDEGEFDWKRHRAIIHDE